jgi:hypothetical protein
LPKFALPENNPIVPRLAAASDKVYQLIAHGRWFSPGTPDSSTTKTGYFGKTSQLFYDHMTNLIQSKSII